MDLEDLCRRIESVWLPGNFYLMASTRFAWQFEPHETIPWEIFRGRLLEDRHCRTYRTFRAWNVRPFLEGTLGPEPFLSIKLDEERGEIHVTRGILSRLRETTEPTPGHPEERDTTGWTRELVGTLNYADAPAESLLDELALLLHHAIVGTSRLPLTSLEAPLPSFLFGRFYYLAKAPAAKERPQWPLPRWEDLLHHGLLPDGPTPIQAKLVEVVFRSAGSDEESLAAAELLGELWFARGGTVGGWFGLLRTLFLDVSLSPWTGFVPRLFAGLDHLVARGLLSHGPLLDFLTFLVRLLDRHLAAYDLITYHHRGANYPDALVLESVLERLQSLAAHYPQLFLEDRVGVHRRGALRQAMLIRRFYRELPVPETPTSPGELTRVLPEGFPSVPEEHILQTRLRPRRLFPDATSTDPLYPSTSDILRRSFQDLENPREQASLGMALFLERPLGESKAPGEPDRTPLLSYLTWSHSVTRRRLRQVAEWASEIGSVVPSAFLASPSPGLPIAQVAPSRRPTVALADAAGVASDFLVLRTLQRGLLPLLNYLGSAPGLWHGIETSLLARLLREGEPPVLTWFDANLQPRLTLEVDASEGFLLQGGHEFPRRGIKVRTLV